MTGEVSNKVGAKRPRLRSTFTVGGEQAEADALLDGAFYDSDDFAVIASREDKRCFVVGRTGSGKSAALQRLEELNPDHVIRISPEDLSLPYITNLQAIRYLDSLEINLDNFWTTLWKHVLLVEIIRHRYKVNSPAAKQNFLSELRDRVKRDQAKRAALEYLDEYEGRFWEEADQRVREITQKFTEKIDAEAAAEAKVGSVASVKIGGKEGFETSSEFTEERVDRFQRIVNDTQLARLNKMINVLDDEVLNRPQHFTYVVIDDLDRDWVDERIANDLIRCLFRTVIDLKRVRHLKVLVALRTNIFQELQFGRRGGGQEEKFRALVLLMKWTKADLTEMLDERVRVAAPKVGLQVESVADLFPNANKARGNPLDYMLDRTLLRPRDAISFVNECLALGAGSDRVSWSDLASAEQAYSSKRLLALRDEWKQTYPDIDQVFEKFRGSPVAMSRQDLQERLDSAMLLLSEPKFSGVRWMTDVTDTMWNSSTEASWFDLYQPLLKVLFTVGLIGCSRSDIRRATFYSDDPLFIDQRSNIQTTRSYFVHRAFHRALDIR
ncbi:P-loop ATPase, Sll1717 family [Pseudonocardia halophobica]|uniref:P-loop ATPase, Sll1717 family n=1 Tax=Pseudonocardia halophobica TaxID=29401 RepID=UPI003D90C858